MSIQVQLKEAAGQKRLEAIEARKRVNELVQAAEQAEKEAEGTQAAYDAYIASTSGTASKAPVHKGSRNKVKAAAVVKKAPKAKAAAAPKKAPKAKAAAPKKVPKAKAAPKAKVAAAPKKKVAAKAKAPTAKKSAANAKISKTRKAVADGKIPPLKERLRQVMGSKELEVKDIIAELEKKGWLPDSKDPSTYMSFMLSSSKDDFERVSRGKYRVLAKTGTAPVAKAEKKTVTPRKTNGKAKAAPKGKAEAGQKPAAETKATAAPSNGEVEKELASLGTNVAENPFL